ncbi:MAG: cation transporting ATPase C-terminal domain-containing protein, partial [Eubacteriales bacterium]
LIGYLHGEGEVVGVVGRRLADLCLLRAADVSFAQNITVQSTQGVMGRRDTVVSKVSESAAEEGCEALKFESDIIISDADSNGQGGFRAILDALGIAKNTDMNVVRIMRYLLTAQTARFLLVLYTILFSKEGMNAVQALFSGLFMDFLSVFIIAFQKPSPDVLRLSYDAEPWLAHPIRTNIPSVLTGITWACTAISASFFASLAGFTGSALSCGSVLFVTSAVISILMLFSVQREDFIWRPGVRMSALHAIYLLAVIELFLLFFLFPKFGTVFGVASFSPAALLIIFVFCLIQLVLAECIKMLARMRENPSLAAQDGEQAERHSEIAALFRLFRENLEQENRMEREEGKAAGEETDAHSSEKAGFRFFRAKKKKPSPESPDMTADRNETNPSSEAASLSEMEEYIRQARKNSKAQKPKRAKKVPKKQRETAQGNPSVTSARKDWFSEDENDMFEPLKKDVPRDDVLAAALKESFGGIRDDDPSQISDQLQVSVKKYSDVGFSDSAQTDDTADDAGLQDDLRPDPDAFASAMESGTAAPSAGDITIGGTDAQVRSFLRTEENEEREAKLSGEADREFLGIGYLFSEEEYEAIMAAYNKDGTTERIYNTDTQKFDIHDDSQKT